MAKQEVSTGTVTAARAAVAKAKAQADPDEKVHVWPHLLTIELIGALVYLFLLTVMSVVIDAPLLGLANPEVTPNPAKAPWYFLGLQELLLHMRPSLAGVIVPTAVLVGLATIPYIDVRRKGTGIWFYSEKGVPIALFSALYTAVWEIALILVDEFLVVDAASGAHGIAPLLKSWSPSPIMAWLGEVAVPVFFMLMIPASLAWIVRKRWDADTREVMIALFSFFVASFVLLTIVGTAFRGEGMRLMWPWDVKPPTEH